MVFRRVGGLEGSANAALEAEIVFRRVGGLEVAELFADREFSVFRRVGGLEDIARWLRRPRHRFPPCRRFRSRRLAAVARQFRFPPCRRFRRVSR